MRQRWCPKQRQQHAQHLSNDSRLADVVARNEQQASELVFGAVSDPSTASSMPLRRMRPRGTLHPKQFSDLEVDALRSQMWRLRQQPGTKHAAECPGERVQEPCAAEDERIRQSTNSNAADPAGAACSLMRFEGAPKAAAAVDADN